MRAASDQFFTVHPNNSDNCYGGRLTLYIKDEIVTMPEEPKQTLYLYNRGDECEDLTGGWHPSIMDTWGYNDANYHTGALYEKKSSYLNIGDKSTSAFGNGGYTTGNKIKDFVDYDYLNIKLKVADCSQYTTKPFGFNVYISTNPIFVEYKDYNNNRTTYKYKQVNRDQEFKDIEYQEKSREQLREIVLQDDNTNQYNYSSGKYGLVYANRLWSSNQQSDIGKEIELKIYLREDIKEKIRNTNGCHFSISGYAHENFGTIDIEVYEVYLSKAKDEETPEVEPEIEPDTPQEPEPPVEPDIPEEPTPEVPFYLYNEGNEYTSVTGGWYPAIHSDWYFQKTSYEGAFYKKLEGALNFGDDRTTDYADGAFATWAKVKDVSDYDKLCIEFNVVSSNKHITDNVLDVALVKDKPIFVEYNTTSDRTNYKIRQTASGNFRSIDYAELQRIFGWKGTTSNTAHTVINEANPIIYESIWTSQEETQKTITKTITLTDDIKAQIKENNGCYFIVKAGSHGYPEGTINAMVTKVYLKGKNNQSQVDTQKVQTWEQDGINIYGKAQDGTVITALKLGDYINYDATNEYSYTSARNKNGKQDQTFNTSSSIKWRVIGVENGQLIITTESYLGQGGGYSFVISTGYGEFTNTYRTACDELNNISQIYGYGYGADKNIPGKSINAETIANLCKAFGLGNEVYQVEAAYTTGGPYYESIEKPFKAYAGSNSSIMKYNYKQISPTTDIFYNYGKKTEGEFIAFYKNPSTYYRPLNYTAENNLLWFYGTEVLKYSVFDTNQVLIDLLKSKDGKLSGCWFANYRDINGSRSVYNSVMSGNKILIGYSHITKSFDEAEGGRYAGVRPVITLEKNIELEKAGTYNNCTVWNIKRVSTEPKYIPEDAEEYNGHYYKIFNENLTWKEAKQKCEAMGGHLATITSQEEQDCILEIQSKNNNRYWIGGTDEDNEGQWKWVTGENFNSYTHWKEFDGGSEPNNLNDVEHYLHMYEYGHNGKWNDASYDTMYGYICEWE